MLSFVRHSNIQTDNDEKGTWHSGKDRQAGGGAGEMFFLLSKTEASAVAFDSRGSQKSHKQKQKCWKHSKIGKNIYVRDFEICFRSVEGKIISICGKFSCRAKNTFSRWKIVEKNLVQVEILYYLTFIEFVFNSAFVSNQ